MAKGGEGIKSDNVEVLKSEITDKLSKKKL
jgi:hypothetical protein